MRKSIIISMIITVVISILSVELIVRYKKLDHSFRNQYERLSESFTKGHLYIDAKVNDNLIKLSNPYDPMERSKARANYLFDYSFYEGRYYVYFGVVPVITTYLPYRLITGTNLYAYHSIEIFICLFIIGIFMLFKKIKDCFFEDGSLAIYIIFSMCTCFISVWLAFLKPTVYSEAIVSGMCFSVWSLFFWFKACFDDNSEKKELLFLTLGNFFGSLVFGCRPPIGFFNILIIPILLIIIKKRDICIKRVFKVLLTLLPYIIVFMLLFLYNYLRFDNPFEFGKSYQLSLVDSTSYISIEEYDIKKLMNVFSFYIFSYKNIISVNNGLFISFPILFLNFGILMKRDWEELRKNKILLFMLFLIISCLIIGILDSIYNFRLVSRYRMDICFLLSIGSFICYGMFRNTIDHKKIFDIFVSILCVISFIICTMLLLTSLNII